MIGLDPTTIFYLVSGAAAFLVIGLGAWLWRTEKRLRRFLSGRDAQSLEGIIARLEDEVKRVDKDYQAINRYLETVERRLKRSVQRVKTIRFNPFRDQGSNQSFVVSLLDEEGNGATISSIYSREKVSVYAKPIINHSSSYELSEEERQAIAKE